MKKIKKILSLFFCFMLLPLNVGALESYKELDPDNTIGFPFMVWNNNDNQFNINKYVNYDLYYQYQLINKEIASKIETLRKEGESQNKDEINNKKNACNALKDKYNTDKSEENMTAYNDCVTEYNSLIETYNKKLDEINEAIFALYPDYDDSQWIQTTDNKFNGTIKELTEDTMVVLWVKLVDKDSSNIIYDAVTVTLKGNKIITDSTDNKKENSDVKITTTNQQETNPNTGDYNVLYLVVIGAVAIVLLVISRKKLIKIK